VRLGLWSICALGACGRVAFDPVGDLVVDPLGPWGPRQTIMVGDVDDPAMTNDRLELFFESARAGGQGDDDLWHSVRTSVDQPWPPPANLTALNTAAEEGHPALSADGLTLWFASDRGNASDVADIYVTTRATRDAPWDPPTIVSELNDAGNNESPSVDLFALRMALAWGPNSVDENLMEATRASVTSAWSTPQLLTSLNSSVTDSGPVLDATGRVIYFSSTRDSATADLFVALRPSLGEPFEAPSRIDELSTDQADTDPWITPDQRYIMWCVDQNTLYEASR